MTTESAAPPDIAGFIAHIQSQAGHLDEEGKPIPVVQGSFAMYPMDDGGIMAVSSVEQGPMAGVHHHRIPPALIRAAVTLAGGGGKLKALKTMMGR